MSLSIAYLINQYPKVSHSFIRREILAVEALGVRVERFSVRSCSSEIVDAADFAELAKTRIILDVGLIDLLMGCCRVGLTRPIRWLQALGLTLKMGWTSERGLLRHLAYWAEACILLHWLAAVDVTHVHAHFGTNSTTVAMLCHLLGGPPYSFTVHGPEEFDKPQTIHLEEKINRASFVVGVSSFGKSQLYRWCSPDHWAKIHVIHCGLDPLFLQQPIEAIPDLPHLVCVGRLCEDKGQLLLLHAVAQLAAAGVDFKLTLVGDGPLRPHLEQVISSLDLQEQIDITGWVSSTQVREYILAARALVLPTFAEGLPVVLMEALALGRPVITTYIAGIPELVLSNGCGWLVPAGSVSALTDALQQVLSTSVAALEQMGQIGAERVLAAHHAISEASKLVQLIEAIAGSQSSIHLVEKT